MFHPGSSWSALPTIEGLDIGQVLETATGTLVLYERRMTDERHQEAFGSGQASSNLTPLIPVRMSIRHGGRPNCTTMSGRARSTSLMSSASSGAPNAASAVQTVEAFDASTQPDRR
jgi:hypothetical protein